MKRLSKEFQESIIQKNLMPGGPSLAQLAKDHDLPVTTVYGWKKKYANDSGMKKAKRIHRLDRHPWWRQVPIKFTLGTSHILRVQ